MGLSNNHKVPIVIEFRLDFVYYWSLVRGAAYNVLNNTTAIAVIYNGNKQNPLLLLSLSISLPLSQ